MKTQITFVPHKKKSKNQTHQPKIIFYERIT